MKYLIIIPLLCVILLPGIAQKSILTGTEIPSYKSEVLDEELKAYQVFKIDLSALQAISRSSRTAPFLHLQLGTRYNWPVQLSPNEIRTDSYQLTGITKSGMKSYPRSQVKTFEGNLALPDGGSTHFVIDNDQIYGALKWGQNEYFIEPVNKFNRNAPENYIVVYKDVDVNRVNGATCGSHFRGNDTPDHTEIENIIDLRMENCLQANVALAADYSMVEKFQDIYDLENHLLFILSLVQTNYDDEFNNGSIQFKASTITVSECPECDPWPGTDQAQVLLDSFTVWGQQNGFQTTDFDVATLWTDREWRDSIVGLGWIGELCNNFKYNIIRDITSNSAILRMLQSHEIGHNFGAVHDSPGSNTIMEPSPNESNVWSTFSFLVIDRNIVRYRNRPGCLESCEAIFKPQADFIASNTIGCLPLTVQFENRTSGSSVAMKWVFEGGEPAISYEENPTVVYSETGTYKVTLMAANSFGGDTISRESFITIDRPPVAGFDISYVPGDTFVVFNTASTQNANFYLWDFGDASFSNERNPRHQYTSDGLFPVRLITRNDCGADTLIREVMYIASPTAAFSANETSGCFPLAVNFENQSSGFMNTFTWTFEGGTPGTSTEENPVVTYNQPGRYKVTLRTANPAGGDTIVQENLIAVFGPPSPQFYVDTTLGSSIVHLRDSTEGANNKIWLFDGEITILASNNNNYDFGTEGVHEVAMITSNECGSDTLTESIEIFFVPEIAFEATPEIGCAPLEVEFTNGSSGYKASYLWQIEGIDRDSIFDINPTVTFSLPGSYEVKLEAENLAGKATEVRADYIQAMSMPSAGFTSTVTLGDPTVIFTDTSALATSYLWDFGDGETSTETNPEHTYVSDGTYNVQLIVENPCGKDTISRSVEVLFSADAAFSFDQGLGCSPHTVNFTSFIPSRFGSILWVFEGGFPEESIELNPSVVYDEAGVYSVKLFVFSASGIDSLVLNSAITIRPQPTAKFTMTQDRNRVQFNNTSQFAESFFWDFGDGNTSTMKSPAHVYTTSGKFNVMLLSVNSCDTARLVSEITIGSFVPRAAFSSDQQEGCAPFTVRFIDESFNADTYLWEFPGGNPSESTMRSPTVIYETPGVYNVNLLISNTAGTALVEKTGFITVLDPPKANFSFQTDGLTLITTNLSENSDTYIWDFGDGFGSDAESPTYIYSEKGKYTVQLIARSDCGRDTASIEVDFNTTAVDEPEWGASLKIFPNPNQGDFVLHASGINASDIDLEIMDITGKVLVKQPLGINGGNVLQNISASDLPSGLYLIRIGNSQQAVFRKISIFH